MSKKTALDPKTELLGNEDQRLRDSIILLAGYLHFSIPEARRESLEHWLKGTAAFQLLHAFESNYHVLEGKSSDSLSIPFVDIWGEGEGRVKSLINLIGKPLCSAGNNDQSADTGSRERDRCWWPNLRQKTHGADSESSSWQANN